MQRYAWRDDQWTKIEDFLPGREGHLCGTGPDNRLFLNAVIYRYRSGIPWRDLPGALRLKGDAQAFPEVVRSGVSSRVLAVLALDVEAEYMMRHLLID